MLQIKTTKLQEMLSKAIKGVSNNKLIPLTSLLAIELRDGSLTLITTDATNYLYIIEDVSGDDFYVTVQADQFAKLIARMTCEDIILDVKDNCLEVVGNGKYSIALPLDEDGSIVKYPDPANETPTGEKLGEIQVATIKSILNAVKPALATTMELPQYTNYYVGDSVMATDTYKISSMKTSVLSKPTLISAGTMELIDVITQESVEVYTAEGGKLKFTTPNGVVYGPAMPGIDNYQISSILAYVDKDYPSMCKLPKLAVLQLIDRLSLFVSDYDDGVVQITFTPDGLLVNSKQLDGEELIKYLEVKDFADCSGLIDLEMLRAQVKAQTSDAIELWFGDSRSIKMVDNNITLVAALINE